MKRFEEVLETIMQRLKQVVDEQEAAGKKMPKAREAIKVYERAKNDE